MGSAGTTPPDPPFTRGKNTLCWPNFLNGAATNAAALRWQPVIAPEWNSYWLLAILLLATFVIRALHAGQPIVENYVGRQVPTAMVARNLDRGSGLLRPQLDTAPFPNFFLVEPPIYEAGVVVLKRADRLEPRGGGTNSFGTGHGPGGLGLFALARRREGAVVAYLAVAAFAVFPLTIRYGRAFQPDAAMLGAVVLGLACWDQHRSGGRWYWLAAGWSLVAVGFALKITAAFLLVPLVLVIARARSLRAILVRWLDTSAGGVVVCVGRSSARIGRRLARFGRQPVDLARARRALIAFKAGDAQVRALVLARASVYAVGCGPGDDRSRGGRLERLARPKSFSQERQPRE